MDNRFIPKAPLWERFYWYWFWPIAAQSLAVYLWHDNEEQARVRELQRIEDESYYTGGRD
jgi:hypothetical protein